MGFQDRLADARKAAERARAQQQEWSQARHEAKEQQALAKQETEAEKKAAERQAPAVKVMRYKNTKDYERDARQMLAQGWRIEAQTSQRGRVNMGRTVLKAGVFLPWAVMRPSRKGDPITVTWLRGGDLVEIDAPGEQLARPAAAPTRGKISVVDWSTWKPGWPAAAQTLNDVGLAKVLEHCHIPVEGLDQTAISQIGTVLADGITNGLTGPALARQIRAYVGGDKELALTIAVTVTAWAQQSAQMQSYHANGVEMLDWLAGGQNVCDDCQANADGGPYATADFPDLPAHPRCVCASSPNVASLLPHTSTD